MRLQAALRFIFALYTLNCSVGQFFSGFKHFQNLLMAFINLTIMTLKADKVQRQLAQLWSVLGIQNVLGFALYLLAAQRFR